MKIGEAADQTGLSVSNIRFYERKGLLSPSRKESGYREYEPEDVRRLKEIILLRRLGLPVESIFLLYEGKADLPELLKRQEQQLAEEMKELEGSLKLCRLLEGENGKINEIDVDHYLNYVREEEAQGGRFAEAEDLLEDLAEFSHVSWFRGDPYVGRFFRSRWTARVLTLLLVLALLWSVYDIAIGPEGNIKWHVIGIYALIFGLLAFDFWRFRRMRHEEAREEQED